MDLRQEQINSLKWAVDELEKEKTAIASRWEKSQEASGLQTSLEEALSEQQSLSSTINDMEGSLRDIGEGEAESLSTDELESQKASLQERIIIASERLEVLQQERELERIALRFRGVQPTSEIDLESSIPLSKDLETTEKSMEETSTENRLQDIDSLKEPETIVRSHAIDAKPLVTAGTGSVACSETTSDGLREVAIALDLDPEYLLDKSVQAILRMIERNKNRVTFPLEVKQVDSID